MVFIGVHAYVLSTVDHSMCHRISFLETRALMMFIAFRVQTKKNALLLRGTRTEVDVEGCNPALLLQQHSSLRPLSNGHTKANDTIIEVTSINVTKRCLE